MPFIATGQLGGSPGVIVREYDLTNTVQQVSISTGAIAGVFRWGPVMDPMLIGSQTQLATTFFTPTTFNAGTWYSAWNFLAYANQLYVVRCANTTSNDASVGALNAVGNTAAVANILDDVVLNSSTFEFQEFTDTNVVYIAKYPGALGNSLRVSTVDTANAFMSQITLTGTVANGTYVGNTYDGVFEVSTGANAATMTFTANGSSETAGGNTWANTIADLFEPGDLLYVGNTGSYGTQLLKITGVGAPVTNSTVSTVTLNFQSNYSLASNYSSNTIQRQWEFSSIVTTPPGESPYVLAQTSNSAIVDQKHVVVIDQNGAFSGVPGTVLEVWTGLSRATDCVNADGSVNYYQTVLNRQSKFLWAVQDTPGAASAVAASVTNSNDSLPVNLQFNLGTDGYDENSAELATITAGYDLYASPDDISVNLIMQGVPKGGTGYWNGGTYNNYQLAQYVVQLAQNRMDAVAFISPDYDVVVNNSGSEATDLVNWLNLVNFSSSYGVMDSGWKNQYDPYNGVYRYIPLNGDIAGLCARTDQTNAPWWSPAGFTRGIIQNVNALAYNPDLTDRSFIYPNGINPVVTFPNYGTMLFGDRTMLAASSAFQHINVRRLFIELEQSIAVSAQLMLFEFNNTFTQNSFLNLVNPYLRSVEGQQGIYDFLVVCDATNNTPQVVDSNEFVGDIYIKPARSINWIILDFIAVPTGVQFSEVVGQFGGL